MQIYQNVKMGQKRRVKLCKSDRYINFAFRTF